MTSDLWAEVKNSNFILLLWCILKYRFFGSRISNMTSFYWWDLFEATQWPLIRGQKFKSILLPWCILKCRFFESRNSSMTSFFWSDLSEATQWPMIRGQKLKSILLSWCGYIEIKVFWIKEFKNDISFFLIWPLRGY